MGSGPSPDIQTIRLIVIPQRRTPSAQARHSLCLSHTLGSNAIARHNNTSSSAGGTPGSRHDVKADTWPVWLFPLPWKILRCFYYFKKTNGAQYK